MCIEMYANAGGGRWLSRGGRGGPGMPSARTSVRSGGRGSALGHSCQIAVAGRAVEPSFFFSFSFFLLLTSKVNLFTVIFFVCELFAIIGCADEGHPLGGDLSVFRELILFKCSPCN